MSRIITVFCLIWFLTGIYFFGSVGLQNSGDSPQYSLAKSIVESRSLYIDDSIDLSWPDVAKFGDHFISGRSPGESFLIIPFFWISTKLKHLTVSPYNGHHPGINETSALEAASAIGVSLFGALSAYFVFLISRNILNSSLFSSFMASVSFALGSLIWKYSSSFFRHPPNVFFILLSTYYFLKIIQKKNSLKNLTCLGIGLGGSILTDPTSIVFVSIASATTILILFSSSKPSRLSYAFYLVMLISLINLPQLVYKNTWLVDKNLTFSSPFLPSLYTNLFSPNQPIKPKSLSTHPGFSNQIKFEQGYKYALTYPYKGIFFQSPFLFLIFFSIIKHKKIFTFSVTLALLSILFSIKYLVYYSPNSYDTRFFIPAVAILSPLLSSSLDYIFSLKRKLIRLWLILFSFTLILVSWIVNFISTVENFAPHITGEKRMVFSTTLFSDFPINNLFVQFFPNIYNYKVLLVYILISLVFLIAYILFDTKKNLSTSD